MIMCELKYNGLIIAKHKKPSILFRIKEQVEKAYNITCYLDFYNIDRLEYTE